MRQKLKTWLPAIIWAGVIFFFSGQAINKITATFSWWDFIFKKSCHVGEYAVFFWLVWRANHSFKLSFLMTFLFALSDEWHQTFVPGREGTLRDVGFDSLGLILAYIQIKTRI